MQCDDVVCDLLVRLRLLPMTRRPAARKNTRERDCYQEKHVRETPLVACQATLDRCLEQGACSRKHGAQVLELSLAV